MHLIRMPRDDNKMLIEKCSKDNLYSVLVLFYVKKSSSSYVKLKKNRNKPQEVANKFTCTFLHLIN